MILNSYIHGDTFEVMRMLVQLATKSLRHRRRGCQGELGTSFWRRFSSLTEDFLKLYIFLQNRYQDVPITDCNNEQMSPFWGDKRSTPPQFRLVGGETLPSL